MDFKNIMELLYLFGTTCTLLLLTLVFCFDNRRPMSSKLKYKYRVKDDSIFRKIIKFKDKKYYPCNYFKIVPFYVFMVLSIISFILLLIDIFSNGYITNTIQKNIFTIIMISLLSFSILYFIVITIWWEIVDYKEFKLTNEEKKEIKNLKKFRKNKNNKK